MPLDPISVFSLIIGTAGFIFGIYTWQQSSIQSRKIAGMVNGLAQLKYIVGRKQVWDSLGDFYERATYEIKLMGIGADLSESSVKHDIASLQKKTKQVVGRGIVYRRIQTLNTWICWLESLAELKKDAQSDKDRSTVIISFTTREPKFVPQINIKDKDETILIPAEKSREDTVCFNTRKKDFADIYIRNFYQTESTCVGPFSSRALSELAKNLREVKKTQFKIFLCHYFRSKKIAEKPTYKIANDAFPLDKMIFKEETMKLVEGNISSFLKTTATNLATDLKHLFPSDFGSIETAEEIADKLANEIASRIPLLATDEDFIRTVRGFLADNDVISASENALKYLSQAMATILNQLQHL